MRYGYVYLLCSQKNGTLYLGMTNDLAERLHQHKTKYNKTSFSASYNVLRLVWYERFDTVVEAIACEKRMKKWKRQWKVDLIEKTNPNWSEIILGFDY